MLHKVIKYEHASIHKLGDSDLEVVGSDEGVLPVAGIVGQVGGTAVHVNREQ